MVWMVEPESMIGVVLNRDNCLTWSIINSGGQRCRLDIDVDIDFSFTLQFPNVSTNHTRNVDCHYLTAMQSQKVVPAYLTS